MVQSLGVPGSSPCEDAAERNGTCCEYFASSTGFRDLDSFSLRLEDANAAISQ